MYCSITDSTVRPRSAMSRRSRRMKRMSSGVSTKTLMSNCSSNRGSAKIKMPSTITIGLGSTVRVSFKRDVRFEIVERQFNRFARLQLAAHD